MVPTEKPEELVKAMEAIKNACKAVNDDFAENPLGEKPASVTQTQVKNGTLYGVVKELYRASATTWRALDTRQKPPKKS